jgi:hypothetical protein
MNPEYVPFGGQYNDWADVPLCDLASASDVGALFAASEHDGDDESSVASDVHDAVSDSIAFPTDKEFATFEDLRSSVMSFARLSPAQIGDNTRCATSVEFLPTQWLKKLFPTVQGSVKYSGFLYCRCDHSCEWKVNYKLRQNGSWAVLPTSQWTHSHELSMLSANAPCASGLVHLKYVNQLSVEHKTAIISFLEGGLSVKVIRFKFRQKFPGFELRARCCKSIKTNYLKDKYGADRHQMSKFMQQLKSHCNPMSGGVCDISYYENMEIAELYFQLPLLRKVGEYFGKFSVIDASHNMSMYERNMATFNVSILKCGMILSLLKIFFRHWTAWGVSVCMVEHGPSMRPLPCSRKALSCLASQIFWRSGFRTTAQQQTN